MANISVTTERFGGLDLRDDPGAVGMNSPVSVTDVDITNFEEIGPRPGWKFWADPNYGDTHALNFLYALPDDNRILSSSHTALSTAVWNADGTLASSATDFLLRSAVDIATESQAAGTYAVGGGGVAFIDSSGTISIPSFSGVTPAGDHISAWKSRLVFSDGNDRVYFSDDGDPLTITYGSGPPETGNFVDLDPRDGEVISGIVAWREFLMVFKKTKIFVFYDIATFQDSAVEFQYHTITNVPALDFTVQSIAVGREGVYYVNRDGVWVTTGDTPVKLSNAIDPLFASIPNYRPPVGHANNIAAEPVVHWAHDRLYIALPTATAGNDVMAVWDQNLRGWTLWTGGGVSITALATQPTGSTSASTDVLFCANLNVHSGISVGTLSAIRTLTDVTAFQDDVLSGTGRSVFSTPIEWTYTSGKYPLAPVLRGAVAENAAGESTLRYTDVWGTGTITVQTLAEGGRAGDVVDPGGSLTLGTSPAIGRARYARTVRGRRFQHVISGTGPGSVSRIDRWMRL